MLVKAYQVTGHDFMRSYTQSQNTWQCPS